MANRTNVASPPRVLIASDQNAGIRDLERFLSHRGYFVLRVYAGSPVLERAQAVHPHVILLDAELADRDSLDLSRALRDDPLVGISTPILLLVTGQPTLADHLAALRAGIWELIQEPLDLNGLALNLDTYVLAKVEAERATRGALVDDVTGLYSAQGLARRARDLILQASRHNTAAACVVFAPELAVDANTTGTGGETADLVRRVGHMMKATGRRSDAIGRVGPTELAVVAPGTDAGGALNLAVRFRHAIQAGGTAEPGAWPGFELRAGYDAVGNVRYTPIESQQLLARAARALQLAKAEGKWIRESSERP
ncbi:MAG TPA: diguanylate cyclase [Ktedonobacterales bacterium]|nr:diguanylate cyclase [Ktedonobacterales bacterium]